MFAIMVMLLAPLVAGLVGSGRVDARLVMAIGYALTAWGSVLIAQATTSTSAFGELVPGLMTGGMGLAMLFIPLHITIQTTSRPEDASKAAAFITLAFQLGGSAASALVVTVLDRRTDFHTDLLAAGVTLANPAVREALAHLHRSQLAALVSEQAQTHAFADVASIIAVLAVILIPLVFLLKRQPRTPSKISFE
jgi:MFS transporter, DHA2 family, multidrug resistance protein